jgi:hypothetical protein
MIKENLFEIAREQLEKKKIKFTPLDVIDRAIVIRRRLDELEAKKHRKANRKNYVKNKIG